MYPEEVDEVGAETEVHCSVADTQLSSSNSAADLPSSSIQPQLKVKRHLMGIPFRVRRRLHQLRQLAPMVVPLTVRVLRSNRVLTLVCVASIVIGATFLVVAIGPRYKDQSTRLYTSKFGYGTVARKLGRPFPVTGHTAVRRQMVSRLQAEGLISAEPILVPIVALSRIEKVHVATGDRVKKGQLLVELDSRRAEVKLEAAKLAVKTAIPEKERVIIGSSYISANERPEKEKIRLQAAQKITAIQEKLTAMEADVSASGAASKSGYLMSQVELLLAIAKLSETGLDLKVAEEGRKLSIEIAECKIAEARLALRHRELELEDYKVYSPCDGIIERCMVHAGEYNQDPGKPAFLVSQGIWFEARMDQTNTGRVGVGDSASVNLEAFPSQPLRGRVSRISPTVSYDLGGPEATRPVRPLGSGAPEWPSTYAVRIELDSVKLPLMQGHTGFSRIESEKEVLAIPVAALLGRSGRSAIVYVVEDNKYRPRKVVLGSICDGWAEIVAGVEEGAVVLTDGHHIIESADSVSMTVLDGQIVATHTVLESAGIFEK